jgi:hypothetical protein
VPAGADSADTGGRVRAETFSPNVPGVLSGMPYFAIPWSAIDLGGLAHIPSAGTVTKALTCTDSSWFGGFAGSRASISEGLSGRLQRAETRVLPGVSQGCFQMVTKSEVFWVSHRNSCSVTLLANLSSGQSESDVT